MHNQTALELVLVVILLLASAFDLHQRRIPNRLLAGGLLVAMVLHLSSGTASALLTTYLAGFALGLLMFLPLYLLGGMAAGDVKLMGTVGAFLGPALVFQASLATYCCGGVLAVLIVLFKGSARTAFANVLALLLPVLMRLQGAQLASAAAPAPSVGGMPYAVAITAGTFAVMYLRHT
ncbi:A24 family peptidase [Massilia sp. TWP1-3-3]|uniref:A24 family peptidase n=1 Tax=Massilia sp. TWP1-3-3 TaxID=2804573 RepID=UPI003CEF053D